MIERGIKSMGWEDIEEVVGVLRDLVFQDKYIILVIKFTELVQDFSCFLEL